jgi:hypothetical protein
VLNFAKKMDHSIVFKRKTPLLAENWQKSPKNVAITLTPEIPNLLRYLI